MDLPWKSQKTTFEEALATIKGRREGTITSYRTPWTKVNEATLDGLEWQSMIVIGGRPGTGKTAIKDQIIREGFRLNPAEDIRVLEFSLEMVGRVSAARGFSSFVGRSYKYLHSAENGPISEEDWQKCLAYAREMIKYPIDIVEKAPTVLGFEEIIDQYMEHHAVKSVKDGKPVKKYKKTVITLDHSLLLNNNSKSRNDMLYELGTTLTRVKRKYPIILIILSQLNRSIDHPDRNEDGKYGNYVLDSDIFGADALLQHADTVIGLNRPGKQRIRFYGPDKYIIPDENLMVMHFLKSRNGVNGLTFFNCRFDKMMIEEITAPPTAETRSGRISTVATQ